jgi:hypothetical protein
VPLTSDPLKRIAKYDQLIGSANRIDTAMTLDAAQKLLAEVDHLTGAEQRRFQADQALMGKAFFAATLVARPAMLDSLRHSTRGYVTLVRAQWARATRQRLEALPIAVGERAAKLTGDAWLNADSGNTRPRSGRIGLVVFVDHKLCLGVQDSGPVLDGCWSAYSALRRLAQRFPELDVTLATWTHGYFAHSAIPDPKDEIDLVRRWLLDAHNLPGAIAVTATPFWRLPDPDRRRIDEEIANRTNYRIFFGKPAAPGLAIIVDREGIIVDASSLHRYSESHLAEVIEILVNRDDRGD